MADMPTPTATEFRAIRHGEDAIAAYHFSLWQARTSDDLSRVRAQIQHFAQLVTGLADYAAKRDEELTVPR